MNWIGCGDGSTVAGKRYQRRVMVTMSTYVGLLFFSVWVVKHFGPHGWLLYCWALLPAIPVIVLIGVMGRYLQEEKDEYLRTLTMRSLLVGTAALVGTMVVNDFLRSFASGTALPPFVGYVIFFAAFGIARGVQTMRNRTTSDD